MSVDYNYGFLVLWFVILRFNSIVHTVHSVHTVQNGPTVLMCMLGLLLHICMLCILDTTVSNIALPGLLCMQ
jgi:hypothetical protein